MAYYRQNELRGLYVLQCIVGISIFQHSLRLFFSKSLEDALETRAIQTILRAIFFKVIEFEGHCPLRRRQYCQWVRIFCNIFETCCRGNSPVGIIAILDRGFRTQVPCGANNNSWLILVWLDIRL